MDPDVETLEQEAPTPADTGGARERAETPPTEAKATYETTENIVATSLSKLTDAPESSGAETQGASPAPTQDGSQGAEGSGATSASAAAEGEPKDPAAESEQGAAETEELSDEEKARLAPKVRRRIDRLLRDRASLKPHAEAYRNIAAFMSENSLTAEETAQGFDFMAKVKRGDAKGALDIVEPLYKQLLLATGRELPEDIKAKVEQGYVDEDTAAELARTRAAAATAEQRERLQEERSHRASQIAQQNSVRDALNNWSAAKANDPDFAAVGQHMVRLLRTEFAANPPRDASDAVARANEMYGILRGGGGAAANAGPASTPRPPASQGPSSAHSTARPAARTAPRDLNDAFALAFDGAYRKLGAA